MEILVGKGGRVDAISLAHELIAIVSSRLDQFLSVEPDTGWVYCWNR
jgi:hypothetical protein